MLEKILSDIWKNLVPLLVNSGATKQALIINRAKQEVYDVPPELSVLPTEQYAYVLGTAVEALAADMVVVLMETWVTSYAPGDEKFIQPSLSPNRTECAVMTYKTIEGKAGCHMAEIIRAPDGSTSISENVSILDTQAEQSFNRFLDGVFMKPQKPH